MSCPWPTSPLLPMRVQMDPSGEKPPPTMPTWADLPGDLWAKVFGALEFTERCAGLPPFAGLC